MHAIIRNLLSKLFFVPFVALFASHLAFAQDYINGTGAPVFTTSTSVELGFIDLSNGNLHLEIPIASPAQRGPLSVSERLVYDSRIWSILDNGTSKVWQPNTQNAAW